MPNAPKDPRWGLHHLASTLIPKCYFKALILMSVLLSTQSFYPLFFSFLFSLSILRLIIYNKHPSCHLFPWASSSKLHLNLLDYWHITTYFSFFLLVFTPLPVLKREDWVSSFWGTREQKELEHFPPSLFLALKVPQNHSQKTVYLITNWHILKGKYNKREKRTSPWQNVSARSQGKKFIEVSLFQIFSWWMAPSPHPGPNLVFCPETMFLFPKWTVHQILYKTLFPPLRKTHSYTQGLIAQYWLNPFFLAHSSKFEGSGVCSGSAGEYIGSVGMNWKWPYIDLYCYFH